MVASISLRNRTVGAAFLCAALVLFLQGAFFLVAAAQTPTTTRLQGQVRNGTTGMPAASVAGMPVTLFQMGASGPITRTVQTDPQGSFSFGDVALASGAPYFVSADYAGIHYFSDVLQGGGPGVPISLTVYETETIPPGFAIDRTHFIFNANPGAVTGIEVVQVQNKTDRAFMLPIPLPDDAASVQFNDPRDDFRAVRSSDGSVAYPVLPTTDNILVGLQLNAPGSSLTVRLGTPLEIGQLNVLVSQEGGVQVSSPSLKTGPVFTPPADPSNPSQAPQTFWQLNGSSIAANSTVEVTISNITGPEASSTPRYVLVLGVGGLAAVALLAFPFLRRRQPPAGSAAVDERLERLQEIADLDDEYAAGAIGEEEYRAERAALKAELIDDTDAEA